MPFLRRSSSVPMNASLNQPDWSRQCWSNGPTNRSGGKGFLACGFKDYYPDCSFIRLAGASLLRDLLTDFRHFNRFNSFPPLILGSDFGPRLKPYMV